MSHKNDLQFLSEKFAVNLTLAFEHIKSAFKVAIPHQ